MTQTKTAPKPATSTATRRREKPLAKQRLKKAGDVAVAECRSLLLQAIEDSGVNQAILADRLGKTRSNVAQVLTRGEGNPTIRTMATWLTALGYRLVLDIEPVEAKRVPGR